MNVTTYEIKGLVVIEPSIFHDDRGFFFESYNIKNYSDYLGSEVKFVQDNISLSKKGVLRGLHFQLPPFAQGKLVSVLRGSVLDVAVDLRQDSSTYGKYQAVKLTDQNRLQFWIPEGFAHGFVSLEDNTIFSYKCSNYYSPQHERTILWNDSDLNIDWGIFDTMVSEKDKIGEDFSNFISPF
ncbi:MAG: dTDP-4-dehydrorhamnose 3,5-epimerase [Flavobacteriia bacterium]|jgi:dTDP-4-dehydrorhamnose 3,5-epimerase